MSISRQGALWMEGVVNCSASNLTFDRVQGNAVFISHAATNVRLDRCFVDGAGETGIAIVGSKERSTGLGTVAFPRKCVVSNSVIQDIGQVVKGSASYATLTRTPFGCNKR